MEIEDKGVSLANWSELIRKETAGKVGNSIEATLEYGNIRVRKIEYSPGYIADHWCCKGHIVFILEGAMKIKRKNGEEFTVSKGMSFICGENDINPHMAYSDSGASILIID